MPYPISCLLPYRSENLWEEFLEILTDDYKWICSSLKERGFIFLIAFVILMSMSLLKAVIFIFDQLRKPKMKGNYYYDRRN